MLSADVVVLQGPCFLLGEDHYLSGAFGDIGAYLTKLPYKSEVMDIDPAEWVGLGPGRRTELVNSLESKLRSYELFNQQTNLWVKFDGVTDPRNLGACLRVADGVGVSAVIAPKDHACMLTEAAIQTNIDNQITPPIIQPPLPWANPTTS